MTANFETLKYFNAQFIHKVIINVYNNTII